MVNVWLDDERPKPHGTKWVGIKTSHECIEFIKDLISRNQRIECLSLGDTPGACDVLEFISNIIKDDPRFLPYETFVHSTKVEQRDRMFELINRLYS